MTYDENNVYVGVTCFDISKGPNNINSLRRDFKGPENDMVVIVIEPFLDKTNAFLFGISPFGVHKEGLVPNGGEGETDYSWDHKWFGEVKQYEGYWTAEMAIPFKTLRFNEGDQKWGINLYRIDTKQNERSSWMPIPKSFRMTSLAFTGDLIWDEPLKKPGANLVVIPFVSAGGTSDYLSRKTTESSFAVGGDIKVGITPSLNLDVTFNPDFSQVEVDKQVANLSRFELFFEEKRQFFIENADLFSSFGSETIRPFFSRRIGIAYDSALQQNVQNPILYGARLSGKIKNNWRIGILNMQAAKNDEINLPSQNYSVAVLQRKVFTRSNISALIVNKQPIVRKTDINSGIVGDQSRIGFNRLLGLDYNLASRDGNWTGKAFYHHSFQEQNLNNSAASGMRLQYKDPYKILAWNHEYVGENFNADVGYVPRKSYYRINPSVDFLFYPKSKIINRHGPGMEYNSFWKTSGALTDRDIIAKYKVYFQNSSRLYTRVASNSIRLMRDFDPTRTGKLPLQEGGYFSYVDFSFDYLSDKRRDLYYNLIFEGGAYFNGRRTTFAGNINYRVQPYAVFSMEYAYNKISMPKPYSDADIVLIGPRLDFTFTRNIYFTTFIQYNNQINNVNINSRFQWRFKPVSDLFVVYTDNYFPENLKAKNRAIILKLTYWLNV